jgi:glycosyltransferase involved in cell wall biosynthesis
MKIAIDTLPLLSPLTGVGYYTWKISEALRKIGPQHEYTYYYGYYSPRLIRPGEKSESLYRLKELTLQIPLVKHAVRNMKDLVNYFSTRTFDLYFEPNFVPLKISSRRIVVTVPDFSFALFPEWHTEDKVRYFKRQFWKKIGKANRIIVISDFIKNEAAKHFGLPGDRLTTIHLGIDHDLYKGRSAHELVSLRTAYALPERFILFVGSIEPRKNLKKLLLAYRDLSPHWRKNFKLLLAGFKGWENEEIMALIAELDQDVKYLGYVPEEELGRLYNFASLFVYPSLYEGFGLPPLEAMACGCPVVVSHAASLPEICGEAAHYVDPQDVESIGAGIEKVLGDDAYRKDLIAKGLARAGQFTWEKSAREHLRLFEETMTD